jgi:hypothetical protein
MGCAFSREGGWEVGACGLVAASGFPPLPRLVGLERQNLVPDR